MGWPQITLIVLWALSAGVSLAKDGQPRGNYSFLVTLTSIALTAFILYMGGFFS